MAMPGTETIRFRRPTTGPNAPKPKEEKRDEFGSLAPQGWKRRHQALLQDQVGRQQNGPVVPSLSFAFRLLLLVRTAGAMYSSISDCDEVFNFFEPLHYFQHNSGFQTWELSPQFAVRSWAYLLLHWPLAALGPHILGLGKRQQFFALRICLGIISSYCEARFFRVVVDTVNERVGRYVLFCLITAAGMFSATVAFLPSSFTMYTTMMAASFWFHPASSTPTGVNRMRAAVFFTALGAIVGWPFAAAIGIPIIFEQLTSFGGEIIPQNERAGWHKRRVVRLTMAIAGSALIAIPVIMIDSWAYGKWTFPSLNIVSYNLFSRFGPDLYGTEPASFYILNLFLNFNFLSLAALASLPALLVTYKFDFRRLGKTQMKPKDGEASPYTLLATRLAPFYIWLGILTAQAHKEERFMFPIYPLLCFNASVTIFLIRGWFETAFIKVTSSPYRASKSSLFSTFAALAVLVPALISVGRSVGLFHFYHAPLDIAHHFEYQTAPGILAELGYEATPFPRDYHPRDGELPEWDLSPLKTLDPPVRICYGAEWHRYPPSYLIPEGVETAIIRSDFTGMMPRKWEPSGPVGRWPRQETRVIHPGRFNGANQASAEPGAYADISTCTYLVALHSPSQKPTKLEPDYVHSDEWERDFCAPFLDNPASKWWSRLIWLPGGIGENGRVYGEYCLLRRKSITTSE